MPNNSIGPQSPVSPQPENRKAIAAPKGEAVPLFHQEFCDNLADGIYFVDTARRITYWNRGAEALTGFDKEEAVGRHCYNNFLMHVDDQGCSLCAGRCPLAFTLADGECREAEVSLQHKAGHRVEVAVRVSPVRDGSGNVIGAVEIFRDISAQKALERRASELERLAYQDPLTRLSNRRHTELRLQQALEEVEQFDRKAGLLLMDIDGFKLVNDNYGHANGDLVLQAVAKTLSHTLRADDCAGRWGGEEFLLLAMDVGLEELRAIGERCRTLIGASAVTSGNRRIKVSVSIGATVLEKGCSVDAALRKADELLYLGKRNGGNQVHVPPSFAIR